MKKVVAIIASLSALFTISTHAQWSATVTGVSDYMFNGVSQTNNKPAFQGSLDKAFDNGSYVGTWASNVDFGDETDIEWDVYLGYYQSVTDNLSIDYGLAYYSYHGGSGASEGNYAEVYTKFGYASHWGNSELNFWYAWDYFGTGAGHIITMVAHTFELAPNHSIRLSFDLSNSLDGDKWLWTEEDSSFYHYRLAYQTSFSGFDIEIVAENTNLDYDIADERIVIGIARTFEF